MKRFASFFCGYSRKKRWGGGRLGGESGFADTEDRGWKQEGRKHPERDKSTLRDTMGLGSRTQHLGKSHPGTCQDGLQTHLSA